jgi:signal transduction histidine kinase
MHRRAYTILAGLRPARGTVKAACMVLVGWMLFGFLLAQQVYALQAGRGPVGVWSHAVALELNYCLLWALLTPAVFRIGRAFPLATSAAGGFRFWRALGVHAGISVVFALSVQVVHARSLSLLYPGWFERPSLPQIGRSMMGNLDYGCILYWVVQLVAQSLRHVRSSAQAQVRHAELQEQLAEAQLQALRMQMHPHFLFNALNSVAELIHEDPEAAESALTGLCDLLRIYLRSSEAHEIGLEREVEFLRRYLEIQKLRFEERLAFRIRLDPAAAGAVVPSLILQPLVENAIVHGIADRERGGVIEIDASVQGASLALRVADNGAGLGDATGSAPLVEGKGLRNTRRRLERLYGARHEFSIRAAEGGGTCASIRIPLKQNAEGASTCAG